jgi:hypothetical protein
MQELLQVAFLPVNLFYTILLMLVVLYWLSVILGAIDLSSIDLDLDIDADVDVDADIDVDVDLDADVETDAGTTSGWMAGALHFFNFGKMPFMVIMTVVVMSGWLLSILSNYYLGNGSGWFALAMFIPILFISLVIAKIITTPLIPVFKRLDTTAEAIDYIGMVCKLKLPASASKFGQAEVLVDGAPNLIHVKTKSDETPLHTGEEALIIGKTEDDRYYLIEKKNIF